jgi:hypothetical protein
MISRKIEDIVIRNAMMAGVNENNRKTNFSQNLNIVL